MKSSETARPALPDLSFPGQRTELFSTLRPFFLSLEALLYLIIAGLSLRYVSDRSLGHLPEALSFLRYASILLCFSYAMTADASEKAMAAAPAKSTTGVPAESASGAPEQNRKLPLVQALFFTVCADYFLVFSNRYLPGILFFLLVQNMYRRFLRAPFPFWFCCGSAAMGLLLLFSRLYRFPFDSVSAFSAIYAGCLLANLAFSLKKGPGWFSLSLTLLLFCDFHVALGHLSDYLASPFPGWLAGWVGATPFLIWGFYLPAQVILAAHADAQLR